MAHQVFLCIIFFLALFTTILIPHTTALSPRHAASHLKSRLLTNNETETFIENEGNEALVRSKKPTKLPTIYVIRHGEKPSKLPSGEDDIGLSEQGLQRAQALPTIFGKENGYDIGYIIAQTPMKDSRRSRPRDAVIPLARSQDLKIDTSIDRDDIAGAAKALKTWASKDKGGAVLCWQHGRLGRIAQALGADNASEYPTGRYDLVWTIEAPYTRVTVSSMRVPGLDDRVSEPRQAHVVSGSAEVRAKRWLATAFVGAVGLESVELNWRRWAVI